MKSLLYPIYSWLLSTLSRLKLWLRPMRERQLELGSGPVRKTGWITLDLCRGVDVYWDLRRRLPFEDGVFDRVYSSHVLEHFAHQDLGKLLREVRRVLRPGGHFLIAVPDTALYLKAYLERQEGSNLLRYLPAKYSDRPMDILNYIFYMDGQHRFMFDEDNLAHHCREAGFESCVPRAFDSAVDLLDRKDQSIYMICTK